MRKLAIISLAFGFLVLWTTDASAEAKEAGTPMHHPTVLEARLFKDGYAWVTMELDLAKAKAGENVLFALPYAVHGTLWIDPGEGEGPLPRITFKALKIRKPRQIQSLMDALMASVGSKVTLGVSDGGKVSGILKKCLIHQDRVKPGPPARRVYYPREQKPSYVQESSTAPLWTSIKFALVIDEGVTHLIDVSKIREAIFSTDLTKEGGTDFAEQTALEVAVTDKSLKKLQLRCLTKGLTWAPSFRFDIGKESKGVLSCQALVCNEFLNLEKTKVFLVGGVPNIGFRSVASAAMTTRPLSAFLNSLSTGYEMDRLGKVMVLTRRSGGGERIRVGLSEAGQGLLGRVTDAQFSIPLGELDLATCKRSLHQVLSAPVSFKSLYLWSVPDYLSDRDEYSNSGEGEPGVEIAWSVVEFENNSGRPWTTGPIIVTKGGRLLGQDLLTFTATGERASVRVSRALDIRAQQYEEETNRERIEGYNSDCRKITYKGHIAVQSLRTKPITIRIVKGCSGDILSSTGEPKIRERIGFGTRRNKRHQVLWEFELPGGEKKELTYTYVAIVYR